MIALSISHSYTHTHTLTQNITQELIYNLSHVLQNNNMPVHIMSSFLFYFLRFVLLNV